MRQEDYEVLRQKLLDELEEYREIDDGEIYDKIDELILESEKDCYIRLFERNAIREELFNSVRKLDVIQELVDDNTVTEIMINGTEGIFIERSGKLMKWERTFSSVSKLEDIAQQIVARCNRVVNESVPIVDARLENGARVNIVMPPIALNGPVITIRRFPDHPIRMEELIRWGSITQEAACFLEILVKSGYNIFISGGTGSGKTTFLNALSAYVPKEERLITIEDNAELQIQGVDNLIRLEARNANAQGELAITIRDLIKSSLRMRPDRIIVGEVRGGEVADLLNALNTGHDGGLSTGHGNSGKDMLIRLEAMMLMGSDTPLPAIRRQIASGIDIMIHLGRLRDKSRKVLQILEILDCDEKTSEIRTSTLYEFEEEGTDMHGKIKGSLKRKGELNNRWKLNRAGYQTEAG